MPDEARVLPAIAMNAEIDQAVRAAIDPADIKAAIVAEAEKQLGVTNAAAAQAAADQAATEKAAADAAAASAAETTFKRIETIGGKDLEFEASSELELERAISNAYKVAYAVQPVAEISVPVVDPAVAEAATRKAAEEAAIAKVELEQKFRRGEISAADYITQTGAVEEYLANQGLPLSSLKAAVEQNQEKVEQQSWNDAVNAFHKSPAGRDWPGGDKNLKLIGMRLNPDATDKLAEITKQWDAMKTDGIYFPADLPAVAAVAAVTSPAVVAVPVAVATPAAVVATPRTPSTSSSLFGQGSGVGDGEGVSKIAPAGDVKIDPNASPAEIIEAYKRANFAKGIDPNAAFQDSFAARRV